MMVTENPKICSSNSRYIHLCYLFLTIPQYALGDNDQLSLSSIFEKLVLQVRHG